MLFILIIWQGGDLSKLTRMFGCSHVRVGIPSSDRVPNASNIARDNKKSKTPIPIHRNLITRSEASRNKDHSKPEVKEDVTRE